jgi:hypothetical protein
LKSTYGCSNGDVGDVGNVSPIERHLVELLSLLTYPDQKLRVRNADIFFLVFFFLDVLGVFWVSNFFISDEIGQAQKGTKGAL